MKSYRFEEGSIYDLFAWEIIADYPVEELGKCEHCVEIKEGDPNWEKHNPFSNESGRQFLCPYVVQAHNFYDCMVVCAYCVLDGFEKVRAGLVKEQ